MAPSRALRGRNPTPEPSRSAQRRREKRQGGNYVTPGPLTRPYIVERAASHGNSPTFEQTHAKILCPAAAERRCTTIWGIKANLFVVQSEPFCKPPIVWGALHVGATGAVLRPGFSQSTPLGDAAGRHRRDRRFWALGLNWRRLGRRETMKAGDQYSFEFGVSPAARLASAECVEKPML